MRAYNIVMNYYIFFDKIRWDDNGIIQCNVVCYQFFFILFELQYVVVGGYYVVFIVVVQLFFNLSGVEFYVVVFEQFQGCGNLKFVFVLNIVVYYMLKGVLEVFFVVYVVQFDYCQVRNEGG